MPESNNRQAKIFEYPTIVQPHLTDYSGDLWHGSYLRWLEEARIDALREIGLDYAELVALGCGLPVIDLSLKYRLALGMGEKAIVRSFIFRHSKIRMVWSQTIYTTQEKIAMEALVTLAPVSIQTKKIMRKIPSKFENAIARMMQPNPNPKR